MSDVVRRLVMRSESVGIESIIKRRIKEKREKEETPDFDGKMDDVDPVNIQGVERDDVAVDISDITTEAIELPVINDEHGRLSDLLEALEKKTGLSVIPLEMGHIAPEVRSLSRHTIFENNGVRYAMSHHIRYDVINSLQDRIIKTLSSGLPFEELLNIKVTYNGKEYDTLSLSEDEWKLMMAKFRKYKEKLTRTTDGQYCLSILAERAQ